MPEGAKTGAIVGTGVGEMEGGDVLGGYDGWTDSEGAPDGWFDKVG